MQTYVMPIQVIYKQNCNLVSVKKQGLCIADGTVKSVLIYYNTGRPKPPGCLM